MPPSAIPTIDVAGSDQPVRLAVLVAGPDDNSTALNVNGPVRSAVRAAFAHPRLSAPLQSLHMDAERLITRIVARWDSPGHEDEKRQTWVKSDGSMTVRWWVERDDGLPLKSNLV